jgi:hypothetical protein
MELAVSAARARATVGEISDVLEEVWGRHRAQSRSISGVYGSAYEDDEEFMEPGEVYEVNIDLPFTNYTWLAGHALKIYVSGNNAVRFNVNLQDGGEMYVEGEGNVANITVHHNAMYPSSVELPGEDLYLSTFENEIVDFEVYPNPTSAELNIRGQQFKTFAIYNVLGEECIHSNALQGQRIDVSALSKGIYILQLTTVDGVTVQHKFTKQ